MGAQELYTHLGSGVGTVCRTWAVTRRDGSVLGFTDHDLDLSFDGMTFKAQTGLTARALSQATGLSVDNSEAMGGLSSTAIREEDIAAGRYDEAEVVVWLVNWADTNARKLLFRGHIGEIRRGSGAFHAELRGLSERLARPVGRVYQKPCTAVLGDVSCGFDLTANGYMHEGTLVATSQNRLFTLDALSAFEPGWFSRGRIDFLTGAATGLFSAIKRDEIGEDGSRLIELWEPLRATPQAGDSIRLTAGCDKRFETCRLKFNNVINFQGFPDLPEEDWITIQPGQASQLDGGSRR